MGGGLLETNNQLERFTKNKKSKKLTYPIIGILLIIGSITLFKTYAFFEEKQEFNVLKGKVPEFNRSDITLALTLDGQEVENYPSSGKYKVIVSCDHGTNGSWDYDSWSLNIRNLNNKKIKCQIDFKTETLFDDIQVGDYVSYTPILTSFEISNDLTGMSNYSGDGEEENAIKASGKQTISTMYNFIWRAIRKNSDGSIDLVSDHTSRDKIYFYGSIGYKNYVGALNQIAKGFETEGITSGSRYLGYNGQTEFITNLGNGTVVPESEGGSDLLYETDVNLVQAALGTIKAPVGGGGQPINYFIASRYASGSRGNHYYHVRYIDASGTEDQIELTTSDEWRVSNFGAYVRPIVTLRPGIQAKSGDGTTGNAWKVN